MIHQLKQRRNNALYRTAFFSQALRLRRVTGIFINLQQFKDCFFTTLYEF